MEPKILIRSQSIVVMILLIVGGVLLFLLVRDNFRSPKSLYEEARLAEPERADRLYKMLGRKIPAIEDYTNLWSAQIRLPDQEALDELQAIVVNNPTSPASFQANLLMARAFSELNEFKAESAYRAALELNESPELRLEYARFLEKQNKKEAAYRQYERLISDIPDSFQALRKINENPLEVATDLIKTTYFSDTLDELRDVNDEYEALSLKAQALFGLERYEEALEIYQEILKSNPKDLTSRMGMAKTLSQTGHTAAAISIFEEIDTYDSQLELAKLLENDQQEKSLELYKSSPYPVAWWNATWLLEGENRLDDALELYRRVAEAGTYYSDDAAYRFFVLGGRQNDEKLKAEGLSLLEESGTGWLSMRGLGEDYQFSWTAPIQESEEFIFTKVNMLEELGREDLAYLELLFGARDNENAFVKLKYLQELSKHGYVMDAYEIADNYLAENPSAPKDFWRLNYPLPYADAVRSVANEYEVDPFLLWAIMRVESLYDPDATSLAGARGLLQILPSTQDWIEEKMEITLQPGDAYVPEENIKLGGWYIKYLLEYFKNDLELAILAYNGGFTNVEQWLADPMVNDRDDLIRWIWFGETREYLERVMYAYQVYKEVYNESEAVK